MAKRKSKVSLVKKNKKNKKEKVRNKEEIRRTKIRVIGVGGGGGNIVSEIASIVPKVDFWVANCDLQALKETGKCCKSFIFGQKITQGLGCGSNPKLGQAAAKLEAERIAKLFSNIDFCIFVSCLGGGTGSGAMPEFSQISKENNVLTLGIFTLPFRFEGERKMQIAKRSLAQIIPNLNAFVVIPNERIFQIVDPKTNFKEALSAINNIIARDLKNLIEVIYLPGLINIDFADLRAILQGNGRLAYLASSIAQGERRAEAAIQELISHSLNEYDPKLAGSILFDVAADKSLSMGEVEYISKAISDLNPRAKIIFGISQYPKQKDNLRITLLAVGIPEEKRVEKKQKSKPQKKVKPHRLTHTAVNPLIKGSGETPNISSLGSDQSSQTLRHGRFGAQVKKIKTEVSVKELSKKKGQIGEEVLALPIVQDKTRAKKIKSSLQKQKQPAARKKRFKKEKVITKKKQSSDSQSIAIQGSLPSLQDSRVNTTLSRKGEVKLRKNALDLKMEAEIAEQERLEEEKKWDIPAFLRRSFKSQ